MTVAHDRTALWQDIHAPDADFRWYIPERFNIARACADNQPPEDLALIVDDGDTEAHYTFGDLSDRSARLATVLNRLGLQQGDRVGVMAPQGLEVGIAHLACYRAGLVVVPLSVQFGPDALVYRLTHSGARALIIYDEGFARLQGSWEPLPDLHDVLLVGRSEASGGHPRLTHLDEAVADAQPTPGVVDTSAEDPALLMYTSGTTGPAKGVLHRHQVVLAQMPGVRIPHDDFPQPGDVFWTPGDWAWGGGLFDALLPSWLCGRPIVGSRRKFSPEWAYALMARHGIRNCFLPPTALKQMRQAGPPPADVRLRSIASGGEALGESMLTWAQENLGVLVNEFYGQTEANLLVGNGSGRWPVRPGSMGRPFPGFDIAIVDSDGNPVPDGEQGEVALALPHPGVFLEYWRQPDRTGDKMHDGLLFTGDTATRDEDGYLWFVGRDDDVISSGGYRIGPSEIEECLVSHPDVALAAAIGVSDELRGEAVAAIVVAAEGADVGGLTKKLQDHVKHRLAFYEYPRIIRFVDELPMTTTGKIQRAELRRQFAAEQL